MKKAVGTKTFTEQEKNALHKPSDLQASRRVSNPAVHLEPTDAAKRLQNIQRCLEISQCTRKGICPKGKSLGIEIQLPDASEQRTQTGKGDKKTQAS